MPTHGHGWKDSAYGVQVADEVGGLLVHCCYGCKEKEDCPGEYIVDSQGKDQVIESSTGYVVMHVLCSLHVHIHGLCRLPGSNKVI